ncbi:Flavocytochrome c sulphide dehydrogenase flavin- binding protein [Denitrovibrio acetiphilus DSM 12809]|uniref:Flavocytochrome c sulphide dehydrogenase flavin-binding protein n=1 Tax=Denitrovibrio acetiphilus (strain DSM 12809 / NBRC 114555 / N2460) TaxID=522772 RepID=D4H8U6_DENA2|nr:NAD(P)/FAD-dependent oxidoreductase [Denitrovibrio acetiphilus]ADD68445.1 Flavocytochrome c sulphide dehydrogenase flavin- binding protein [Denitrovibrio acetiphilus DSM 12809]
MSISRRNFVKYTTAAAAGTAIFGCSHNDSVSKGSGVIMPKSGKRIVILGGGWGGATAAKYIKLEDPSVEVVMVERQEKFISCPVSNWVIGGFRTMKDITKSYDGLVKNYGVKVVHAEAKDLDAVNKKLMTTKGVLEYDLLLVSPGISYKYETIEGLNNPAAIEMFPAAMKAGHETVLLAERLKAMEPGGVVLLSVPPTPYRCPPGPYERISLIANFIKKYKPGSKIIVFDSNDGIVSKGPLFKAAWEDYYQGIIEYVPDNFIKSVDASTGRVVSEQGDIVPEVANIIPAMKANQTAFNLGLMSNEGDDWVRAYPKTFESYKYDSVHVIGDATHNGAVGGVPKSGYVANSMAKVAAVQMVRKLKGLDPVEPTYVNTCYSLINETEGIFVSAVYRYDEKIDRIMSVSGGVSPTRNALFGKHARDWATSIWSDMLL